MTPPTVLTMSGPESLTLRPIEGSIPLDMSGYAFVVGAEPNGSHALFSGDGHVWRFDCEDADSAGLPVLNSVVKTWDWEVDVQNPGAFETKGFARMSDEFGYRGPANTAFQVINGTRLLVTCDAGRHWEIDPSTLEAITPVGYYHEWLWSAPHTLNPTTMTTAHPAYDPDRGILYYAEMILVSEDPTTLEGLNNSDLWIQAWDLEGPLERWKVKGVHIKMGVHQMACTEDYIIIVDTSFPVEIKQAIDTEYTAPFADLCDIYIIKRSDLTQANKRTGVEAKHVQLSINCVHLVAEWANPGGRVTLSLIGPGATDGSEWLRASDRTWHSGEPVNEGLLGFLPTSTDISMLAKVIIDASTGTLIEEHVVRDSERFWGLSLFTRSEATRAHLKAATDLYWVGSGYQPDALTERMVELYADHPARWVPMEALPGDPIPCNIFRMEQGTMTIEDEFFLPDGHALTSPTFIPRRGGASQTDGYVLTVVIHSAGTEFWIFDGQSLSQGPICKLAAEGFDMPWTIHTAWMPTLGPRGSTYQVDRARDEAMTAKVYPKKILELIKAWAPS